MPEYPNDADGDALRRVAADGSDMSKPMLVDFMVAVRDGESGQNVAAAAAHLGYRTQVMQDSSEEDDEANAYPWTVYCTKKMTLTYEAVVAAQAELDRLSQPYGGYIDGWGTFGNAEADS
jgi:regulator of RNase E activity RraB